ncbi:MAG: S8 family serine peptidase [Elusimicrobia bacterium]|nr:S8 family serine peptidase [Elusimicrobiota bacterium]
MKRSLVSLFVYGWAAFLIAAPLAFAMTNGGPGAGESRLAKNRMVVRFRSEKATGLLDQTPRAAASELNTLPERVRRLHARWGVKSVARIRNEKTARPAAASALSKNTSQKESLDQGFRRTVVLDLSNEKDLTRALQDYQISPDVEWAKPALVLNVQGVPNDPMYSSLWGMTKVEAPLAWDLATGAGIVVAVVDTGIDTGHADLATNLWANPGEIPANGIDDDANGFVDDVRGWNFVSNNNTPNDGHSHGSHVSGTVAAVGNNGVGVVGLARSAKIMALKGLDDDGSGYDTDLAQCILYAADNGARVINMSWGGQGDSPLIEEALEYAHALGVVLVAAAGNASVDASLFIPAKYADVIAVSAFNSADAIAPFSNFGSKIDVAAPGVSILSTVPGGYYSSYNGTSMAAPHVAGLAALLLSQKPALTNEQVRQTLRLSADDVGPAGVDTQAGYGRINAWRALQLSSPPNLLVTAPVQFGVVGKNVDVMGSVDGGTFVSRQLQYGAGSAPSVFTSFAGPSSASVTNGRLGTWDTTLLSEGLYSLRLLVSGSGGVSWTHTVSPVRVDHTGPVFVSAFPASGITVPATDLTVRGRVTDAYGIERMDFLVDGIATDSKSPSEPSTDFEAVFQWNAGMVAPGSHTLTLSALDMAGNTTVRIIPISVVNDTTPPTVSITSPIPLTSVSGTVPIAATASDNVAVTEVQFQLDGSAPFFTDPAAPYQTTLTTLGLTLGTHTISAVAVDSSGLRSTHTVSVIVVAHNHPPSLSALNTTVSAGTAVLTWNTDEPADGRVEYGTSVALGLTSPLQSALTLTHSVALTGLQPATTYYFRAVSRDDFGNEGSSPVGTFVSSDQVPPTVGITSPPEGAVVTERVEISGRFSDENAVDRVDLLVDDHYWATVYGAPAPQASIGSARDREPDPEVPVGSLSQSSQWTFTLNSVQLSDGLHRLTARAFDEAGHSQDDTRQITVANGPRVALFDPTVGAPLCAQPDAVCASGGLLEARSQLDLLPEPNNPNTLGGSCNDGSSGKYHTDESNDWLQVSSIDGTPLTAGGLVRVDAKVWAYSTKNNYLDLYVTGRVASPVWTHVATLQPMETRAVVLSSTFTLPSGSEGLQAVRGVFRYQGVSSACSSGDYDDHDDLAFAVLAGGSSPPSGSPGQPTISAAYALPHPITGSSARLRAETTPATRVTFDIYSLTGQRVLENPPVQTVSDQTFEYVWDTKDVATGTYYWTLTAENDGEKTQTTQKIAVVK